MSDPIRDVIIIGGSYAGLSPIHAAIRLADRRILSFAGQFALAPFDMESPIAGDLGLDFEQGPIGSVIKTDPMKESTHPA